MLNEFEKIIHNCEKCKQSLGEIIQFFPVISFGNPNEKKIIVVGLNPSIKEYELGFLAKGSIEERHKNQISYFETAYYEFFCKLAPFFMGKVKEKLGWMKSPWEKVGYLDIVKCPTRYERKQWSGLTQIQKKVLVTNCENYFIEQLLQIKPKIILAYGSSVCKWFESKMKSKYSPKTTSMINLNGLNLRVIFLHQSQIPFSLNELKWVQDTIDTLL